MLVRGDCSPYSSSSGSVTVRTAGNPLFTPGFGVWPHSELSPALLESSEDSLAQRASRRLHPSPRPQIIGPIHLGAGNLHTAQEVMDGSSKPVRLSRRSYPSPWAARPSVFLSPCWWQAIVCPPSWVIQGSSTSNIPLSEQPPGLLLPCGSWVHLPLAPWACHAEWTFFCPSD